MSRKPLGFMQLTILCGFSLYYAWYLIAFFDLFTAQPVSASFVEVHVGQVVFFVGSVIATLVLLGLFHRADSVSIGHTRFFYLFSLIPGLTLPITVLLGGFTGYPPLPVFYIACFLTGASVAPGFMLWEDLTLHGHLTSGVLAHGTIFCAGGIVFLLCSVFLSGFQACFVAIGLLIASTALLAFITPRCDTIEDKPVEPVRQYFKGAWHFDIVIAIVSIAFGYTFMALYHEDIQLLFIAMGIALIVDLIVSIIFGGGKWIPFAGSLRIDVAFVSCALLLLACPSDALKPVALCTIVVFWFLFRTMNGGSLTDLANRNNFSVLYASTRGKLYANVGFSVGLALGLVAFTLEISDVTWIIIPLALVAAFILSALFLLPFDIESKTAGYKMLAFVDMHESPDTSLNDLCQAATQRFKLSPRESEVLTFLVRGRNAKHISEKLFISESTAKTHISNIYRKIGVHSQQELLDALEDLSS